MKVIRRKLPPGVVGVLFCPKRTIIVALGLPDPFAIAVVSIALARCDGTLAVVLQSELAPAML